MLKPIYEKKKIKKFFFIISSSNELSRYSIKVEYLSVWKKSIFKVKLIKAKGQCRQVQIPIYEEKNPKKIFFFIRQMN